MTISIKKTAVEDWQKLKDIRLQALQTDPHVFSSKYDDELAYTPLKWQEWLSDPNAAIFLVYDGDTVIGMTGICKNRDYPDGSVAHMWGSWIAPKYRGRGLSELLYTARIEFARQHPTFQKITVGHRRSNIASRKSNQRHGFVFTHSEPKTWPDGTTEELDNYVLIIKPITHRQNTSSLPRRQGG